LFWKAVLSSAAPPLKDCKIECSWEIRGCPDQNKLEYRILARS